MLKQLPCEMEISKEEKNELRSSLAKDDLKRTETRLIQLKGEDVVECRPYLIAKTVHHLFTAVSAIIHLTLFFSSEAC